MALYKDFFIRDTVQDDGNEPVRDASVSHSPDIIPAGNDTVTKSELVNGWAKGIPQSQEVNQAQFNNIYLRTKNNYDGPNSGKAYLYWTAPTLLPDPTRWTTIPNNERDKDGNRLAYGTLTASKQGEISPTAQPFTFYVEPSFPRHFCFVAFIKGDHDARTFPTAPWNGWDGFVRWVQNNANVAWHNVDVLTEVPSENRPVAAAMYNPNKEPAPYGIKACWKNFPNGSQVFLYTLKDADHGFPGFSQTAVIQNGQPPDLWGICDFPAGYSTTVFAYATFPGDIVPANATLTLTSHGCADGSDEELADLLRSAVDPREARIPRSYHVYGDATRFVPIASVHSVLSRTS